MNTVFIEASRVELMERMARALIQRSADHLEDGCLTSMSTCHVSSGSLLCFSKRATCGHWWRSVPITQPFLAATLIPTPPSKAVRGI